jgi:hypothetical protein
MLGVSILCFRQLAPDILSRYKEARGPVLYSADEVSNLFEEFQTAVAEWLEQTTKK